MTSSIGAAVRAPCCGPRHFDRPDARPPPLLHGHHGAVGRPAARIPASRTSTRQRVPRGDGGADGPHRPPGRGRDAVPADQRGGAGPRGARDRAPAPPAGRAAGRSTSPRLRPSPRTASSTGTCSRSRCRSVPWRRCSRAGPARGRARRARRCGEAASRRSSCRASRWSGCGRTTAVPVMRVALWAALAWLLLNAPVAILRPSRWSLFFRFNSARPSTGVALGTGMLRGPDGPVSAPGRRRRVARAVRGGRRGRLDLRVRREPELPALDVRVPAHGACSC